MYQAHEESFEKVYLERFVNNYMGDVNWFRHTIRCKGLFEIPVIMVYCSVCGDRWYEEFYRRVIGYAFDTHVVRLKCNGSCNRRIEQAWTPRENTQQEDGTREFS